MTPRAPPQHLQVVQTFLDAGVDHITLQSAGPDPAAGLRSYREELLPRLRTPPPAGSS